MLPRFYDVDGEITPIQHGIFLVIGEVLKRYGLEDTRGTFSTTQFDMLYAELISHDRSSGGDIYDAVKQIPAFVRLLGSSNHEKLFNALRPGSFAGIAAAGYGIRIDNPHENQYRASWHQEYPSQLRSLDGLVFWSPLRKVTTALGPVQFCTGSHTSGLFPILSNATSQKVATDAYALRLKDEKQVVDRYEKISPLTSPGDLVVIDFLTLHASGANTSSQSRWSLQFRYFNFNDSIGRAHGWKGSFKSGVDFRIIHPELFTDGALP